MPVNSPVKMSVLRDAFDFASAGSPHENRAVVSRKTGEVYLFSDGYGMEEGELPDDVEDGSRYVDLPHKTELDLGRDLVFRFAREKLPDSFELVRGYFAKPGAYGRFKDLLGLKGKLDVWYQYENAATDRALREWAEDMNLKIASDSDPSAA